MKGRRKKGDWLRGAIRFDNRRNVAATVPGSVTIVCCRVIAIGKTSVRHIHPTMLWNTATAQMGIG